MSSHATASASPRILCLGSVNIDDVFSVPHIVRTGETLAAAAYKVSAGGKGANQSAAAGCAGANILHAGKIGADGRWVKRMMETDYAVDCRYLIEEEGAVNTGRAIIQVSQQQSHDNSIILYAGANHLITVSDVERLFGEAKFQRGEWLMLQNEINTDAMQAAIRAAHHCSMVIMINPAPMTSDFSKQCPLELVNILVLNEVESADLYSQLFPETPVHPAPQHQIPAEFIKSMQIILDALCDHFPDPMCGIIITLGEHGLIAKFRTGPNDEWTEFLVPAFPTKVADTTGAGDTFIGYFAADMLQCDHQSTASPSNQSLEFAQSDASQVSSMTSPLTNTAGPRFDSAVVERSLRIASKASSIACSRPGAMVSIPRKQEVRIQLID